MLTSYKYPPGEQKKKEKNKLSSYILTIYNSFSRITLVDASDKTSARRLSEESLLYYDALWCAVPDEKKRNIDNKWN